MSLGQVCKHLQLSIPTLRRLIQSRKLTAARIGGQLRVLVSDLNTYIMASRTRKD